ncbi:MAG: tetratricopeptide repeat protein [Candidatus Omnitrophota bacterium]
MNNQALSQKNIEKIKSAADFVLNNLLIILFLGIAIVYSSREVSDLDIWLHLKTGEHIIQHRAIPTFDMFSYTVYGKPWIDHEWLFQAVTYLFYAAIGSGGLILMQRIVVVAAFAILFFTALKKDGVISVFLVSYLTLLTCVYRFMVRPDIFSILFIVTYLCLLRRSMESGLRFIWLLPFLQIIWANMHGLSFIGVLMVLIAILSELVKRHIKLPWEWNSVRRIDDKSLARLFILLGLLLAASFITPYGPKSALYPLSVLEQISGKGRVIFQFIMELSSPFVPGSIFKLDRFIFYKLMVLVSSLGFFFNRRRVDLFDLILWLFFLSFSLAAHRSIAYFALAAGFVTLNNMSMGDSILPRLPEFLRRAGVSRALRYLCIIAITCYTVKEAAAFTRLVAGSAGTYEYRSSRDGLAQARYPQKAVDFLLKHDFPARIFNDFNSGSYLIGNTFPRRQVFIDGRTELYGPDFFMDYVKAGAGDEETLEKISKRYDIKGFFLTISANDLQDGLLRYLLYNPSWKLVYLDESAVIFLKDIPEHEELIREFRIDLKNWSPPDIDSIKMRGGVLGYPYPYLYRARFFYRHGFYEAAAKEAGVVLSLIPDNSEAVGLDASIQFFEAGNACKDRGDLKGAVSNYTRAVEINPRHAGAYHNRAVAYFLLQDYDKSWDDVHKLREGGADIHPEVLKGLKASSGRDR